MDEETLVFDDEMRDSPRISPSHSHENLNSHHNNNQQQHAQNPQQTMAIDSNQITSSTTFSPPTSPLQNNVGQIKQIPEILPSEIQLQEDYEHQLGEGTFGKVYRGKCRQKDVAIKIMTKKLDEKTLEDFRREVAITSNIYHPNVALFMGACTSIPGKYLIVSELLSGDLEKKILDERVDWSLALRLRMAKDTALGMNWLHGSNIVHRDLKPSNLLIDQKLTVKVCDFGLSQFKESGRDYLKDNSHDGAKGTPLWMAPEVMRGEPFNEKADVYSFGLVLWFLFTKKEPFEEYDDINEFCYAVCTLHKRPPIPPECPKLLTDLMNVCWDKNPQARPTFNDLIPVIDDCIISVAIADPLGQQFWKQKLYERMTNNLDVLTKDFLIAFSSFFQLRLNEIDKNCVCACLENITTKQGTSRIINLEAFGLFLQYFGPLLPSPNTITLVDRVRNLLQMPWFHGELSSEAAVMALKGKDAGEYLVRFSSTTPGCFSISKVSSDKSIKHHKITRTPDFRFVIQSTVFDSLQRLVQEESATLSLLRPSSGWPFRKIFEPQTPIDNPYIVVCPSCKTQNNINDTKCIRCGVRLG